MSFIQNALTQNRLGESHYEVTSQLGGKIRGVNLLCGRSEMSLEQTAPGNCE